jgi:hypothetical protein
MKELLIIMFSLLITSFSFAQGEDIITTDSDTTIYRKVDSSAVFNKNHRNIRVYFSENIYYPMFDIGEEGFSTYWVKFLIEKDGSVSNVETINMSKRNPTVDSTFISLNRETIINMPIWTPAKLNGKVVRSYYAFRFQVCPRKVVRYNYIKN